MIHFSDLILGARITGLTPFGPVEIQAVKQLGDDTVSVIFTDAEGTLGTQLLAKEDLTRLEVVGAMTLPSLTGDANRFKLAAEALRIRLAYLYDPLLAVNTSTVEPLPHQISAVYESMLDRQPLRFLLADDPGAGKTIMAGLLIKELSLRGDVERCLVVVPGNLVEQWQDELWEKFRLPFEIMTNDKLTAARTGNWLKEVSFVIARLDKLSRDEDFRPKMLDASWDLIIFDEAHKLSASRFGSEIKYTKRFQLARALSDTTRHLLLMTATPHNGKEEDFQLFLSLLDADRFEGVVRDSAYSPDHSDLMRRFVKEQLVRFDGTPLFPERRAYTVSYELSEPEKHLYEMVTRYVREEFNRADRLDDRRRGTVGFALTVLQRRLASSPAAIYTSISRRRNRLEDQLREMESAPRQSGNINDRPYLFAFDDIEDLEDAPDEEVLEAEDEAVLESSTAESIEELKAEIRTLQLLEQAAKNLVELGHDRKWQELSRVIQDDASMFDETGRRRKLVIFTEHKDTLVYLRERLRKLAGKPDPIVTIVGGMSRDDRRYAEHRFRQDPTAEILLATDAAGEGINLQQAHLMVNYDLPWNPNRLEQRFGRIHRIGQKNVCHLWNLVAIDTREGQVFDRLLSKLEVENEAFGGRVFDILGTVFDGAALRDLMIRAIRGDSDKEIAESIAEVDRRFEHDHLRSLMEKRALAFNDLESTTVQRIRERMERARLQRLQPYYIEGFFREAFRLLGGTLRERERYRLEVRNVPTRLRTSAGTSVGRPPILQRYERVTFHPEGVEYGADNRKADLLLPGHPLLDSVIATVLIDSGDHLREGAIFIDRQQPQDEPVLKAVVVVEHSIKEGFVGASRKQQVASRRLFTVMVDSAGTVTPAVPAAWLDLDVPTREERERCVDLIGSTWRLDGLENYTIRYVSTTCARDHLRDVQERRITQVEKTRREVVARLSREIAHWDRRAEELRIAERQGARNAKLNSENALRRREELQFRLAERQRSLDEQQALSSQVPVVRAVALVVPEVLINGEPVAGSHATSSASSAYESLDYAARRRIELIAMEAVMRRERSDGNEPIDISSENRGYDIESRLPDGSLRFLEVKGRVSAADEITVTHNEMRKGFNEPERYILAIVLVEPGRVEKSDDNGVRGPFYVKNPFDSEPMWGMTRAVFRVSELISRE